MRDAEPEDKQCPASGWEHNQIPCEPYTDIVLERNGYCSTGLNYLDILYACLDCDILITLPDGHYAIYDRSYNGQPAEH